MNAPFGIDARRLRKRSWVAGEVGNRKRTDVPSFMWSRASLHSRAGSIEGLARVLIEPAVVEALHDGKDLMRKATPPLLLGLEGNLEGGRQLLEGRLAVDAGEAAVAEHHLARDHDHGHARRLGALHDGIDHRG